MKKNLLYFLLLITCLSSCAFHGGVISGSASISSKNFKTVNSAKGVANATRILGIGGLSKDALVAEAKKNLLEKYPLKDGQVLANITVDFKNTFILLYTQTKVTMTADIIEFN
jgi:hypothetical protein